MTTRAGAVSAEDLRGVLAITCVERGVPLSKLHMIAVNMEAEKPSFWRSSVSYDSCLRRLQRAISRAEHAAAGR